MNHTPGPWIVGCCINGSFEIVAPPDRLFICGRAAYENQAKEMLANANLIAAAPDLLEALESVLSWHCEVNKTLDESQLPKELAEKLQAAIKKARGEQ